MILKYYYFFFYKSYKSIEKTSKIGGGVFLTDLKASFEMCILEFFLLFSCVNYYILITNKLVYLSIKEPLGYVPLLIIILIKYILFLHTEKWKIYFDLFEKISIKTKKLGNRIFFIIILFSIINMFLSSYLVIKFKEKNNMPKPLTKEYIEKYNSKF